MQNNIVDLKNEFKKIKNMGWILSLRKGSSGIGYTFEKLLNKQEDNFELPDYKGIEIKTKTNFCKKNIKLFCATPDGDFLFPIQKIRDNFGYPDEDFPNMKIFNGEITSNRFTPIGSYYLFRIKVDKTKKLIRLIVIDVTCNLVDDTISWSFEMLEEKLYRKLKILALVKADKKRVKDKTYYKYNYISFYKLKDFETFINLIESGAIHIRFTIGVFKTKHRYGQIHDHGTQFTIKEADLLKLYNRI